MKWVVIGLLVLAALLLVLAMWMPWEQSSGIPPVETPSAESAIIPPAPGIGDG